MSGGQENVDPPPSQQQQQPAVEAPPHPPEGLSQATPPPPQPPARSNNVAAELAAEQMEIEEMEDHFHSSSASSPSSIFSIPPEDDPHLLSQLGRGGGGVHREGTATPSDLQGSGGRESGGNVEGAKVKKEGGKAGQGASDGGGKSPETQNDLNSEPNDSSGEEESGEDAQTVMDTLSQRLEAAEGGVAVEGTSSGTGSGSMSPGGGLEGEEREEGNVLLASLRKLLLRRLVERLELVEEVGGMRAMSYLQVRTCVLVLCTCLLVVIAWAPNQSTLIDFQI